MKRTTRRAVLGLAILGLGLGAQAAVERATHTDRPPLKRPLSTLPMELGPWVGRDEPVEPRIAEESQATEYLSRVYVHSGRRHCQVWLWINYSDRGLNMRHSPAVCLPSGGWEPLESLTKVVEIPRHHDPDQGALPISLLGYGKGELVQRIGFWYYIFGEGGIEQFVRTLPVSSRSSHGRTTRGSGLTVEVIYPDDTGPDVEALRDFAADLLEALEPILPDERDHYHIP
ncbi:hypothetical protein BH23PLA1_BH23PLA1_08240 [soil metagenome]